MQQVKSGRMEKDILHQHLPKENWSKVDFAEKNNSRNKDNNFIMIEQSINQDSPTCA